MKHTPPKQALKPAEEKPAPRKEPQEILIIVDDYTFRRRNHYIGTEVQLCAKNGATSPLCTLVKNGKNDNDWSIQPSPHANEYDPMLMSQLTLLGVFKKGRELAKKLIEEDQQLVKRHAAEHQSNPSPPS